MRYFLKQSNRKGKTYLQRVASIYNKEKGYSTQKVIENYGEISKLKEKHKDPISYYKNIINKLNDEENDKKIQKITDESPEKNLGYFLLDSVYRNMNISFPMELLNKSSNIQANITDFLKDYSYARFINPCSKKKTYEEVIPYLYKKGNYSLSQGYSMLHYIGENYEKYIETFNFGVNNIVKQRRTKNVFFDCTNYFFEIDRSDDFRKPGPSKENRNSPIVGQALLMDEDCIPLGMHLYPGNQSEKPELREIIKSMKKKGNLTGKTIQVADKGLNCGQNIIQALKENDGYIFSQSVHTMAKIEQEWVLLPSNYKDVCDSKGNVLYQHKYKIEDYVYNYTNEKGEKEKYKVTQKRVAIYCPSLAEKKKLELKKLAAKAKQLTLSKAKKSEFGESGKYITFKNENGEEVATKFNDEAYEKDLELVGYNVLITSETDKKSTEIYKIYHHLSEIEHSFRLLKTQLESRPIHVQTVEAIYGHFTICYFSLLLLRLLEKHYLNDEIALERIVDYIKKFRVVKFEKDRYINLMKMNDDVTLIENWLNLGTTNYIINENTIKKLLEAKVATRKSS